MVSKNLPEWYNDLMRQYQPMNINACLVGTWHNTRAISISISGIYLPHTSQNSAQHLLVMILHSSWISSFCECVLMIIPHQLRHNPDHNCKFNARIQKKKEIEKRRNWCCRSNHSFCCCFLFSSRLLIIWSSACGVGIFVVWILNCSWYFPSSCHVWSSLS